MIILYIILLLVIFSLLGGGISWLIYSPKKEKANYKKREFFVSVIVLHLAQV
jgi:flagellar basal body-associated protein FliL